MAPFRSTAELVADTMSPGDEGPTLPWEGHYICNVAGCVQPESGLRHSLFFWGEYCLGTKGKIRWSEISVTLGSLERSSIVAAIAGQMNTKSQDQIRNYRRNLYINYAGTPAIPRKLI